MKLSCPAVLVSFVNVQLNMRAEDAACKYTVDPGLETKVQSIAVNVPPLKMD
jgi:hypothetical protein